MLYCMRLTKLHRVVMDSFDAMQQKSGKVLCNKIDLILFCRRVLQHIFIFCIILSFAAFFSSLDQSKLFILSVVSVSQDTRIFIYKQPFISKPRQMAEKNKQLS